MKPLGSLINKLNFSKSLKVEPLYFYEVEKIDDAILNTLLSLSITEGDVFGIEYLVKHNEIKSYIFTTSTMRLEDNEVQMSYNPEFNYSIARLEYNNFFPIYVDRKKKLFDYLFELSEALSESEEVVVQLKFHKRQGNWRKLSALQLTDYVHGIDQPTSNSFLRKFQKLTHEQETLRNINEIKFNVLERKIREDNFRFEMIIGTFAKSDNREEILVELIREILSKYNYMNRFEVEDIDTIENLHSPYFHQYEKQYICTSEILTLVGRESSQDEIVNPVSTESITPLNPQQPILQPSSTYALDTLPSLELLPVQIETNEDDVDTEIPNRIKNALKRVKIVSDSKSVKVIDFRIGASLIKTTIEIPKDKNFSDIERREKDIQAALGTDSLTIDQGEVADSLSFFIPRTKKQPIYLRTLLENDEFIKFAENHPLPFVIGVDPLGNPVYSCLNKLTHLLTVGQTNSGKSVWLNQLILTLLMIRKPNEMQMYLIDPKQVEFAQFNGFPQVAKVLDNMNEANKLLEKLIVEMENRYSTYLKEGKVKNLWEYNKKFPDKKVPFIVVIIDEYADLKTVNPTVADHLARLGAKARASGIHVIVATQRPSVDIIDGTTKANLPSKISFKLDSSASYRTVFESKPPFNLTGKGHGIMSLLEQTKQYEQFQGAIISIDAKEEEMVFENIKKSFKGEKVEGIKIEKSEPEEPKQEPIIKMKRIVAEHGETRVGELRKLMEMNINVVTDLMHQLADEGWLNRPDEENRKWSLNENCEELMTLRQMYGGN